jgi:hypothetical protein
VALDHSSECEDLINNLIMQVCWFIHIHNLENHLNLGSKREFREQRESVACVYQPDGAGLFYQRFNLLPRASKGVVFLKNMSTTSSPDCKLYRFELGSLNPVL